MQIRLFLAFAISGTWACGQTTRPAYLEPGSSQAGGVRHLCLMYHGNKTRVPWTAEAILPYVAYVDEKGEPVDWMFDSFLFIEFAADNGGWFHHYIKEHPRLTAADWEWLADSWFREKTGLIGLEGAMARAAKALEDSKRVANVLITLPVPLREYHAFGPLAGQTQTLNLSKDDDRRQAMQWYMERVLKQWRKDKYPHVKLLGFYWTEEMIPASDHDLIEWTADFVHRRGMKLFWIPYFGAEGVREWRRYGIDAMMLQPNHYFTEKPEPQRLKEAARIAQEIGAGIELEFDARALTLDDYHQRMLDYLNAGVEFGYMKDAIVAYYEGGDAIKTFAASPGRGRALYDAVYRFIKGTYTPVRAGEPSGN